MPLYACWCHDGPDGVVLRERHLAAHLAYVEANIGRYAVAGPLRTGGAVTGSLLVVMADSASRARRFLECDPYFKAGIWARMDIRAFAAVAGQWVGGAAWQREGSGQQHR
ncbi:YciI family protein [Porphyrobacter sp. GA68]|uniref:YciI family protein n=1 Tax=Porphyrobacter sp. GA68 TaxID=2883480 RepID=UPI001D1874DE|nr:YciI family protein [Porphyrobacter sp. GA68]